MQHFLAGVKAFRAWGIRKRGEGTPSRAARSRVHQLGPVHGHVVLPVGPGAFVARDLWWSGVLRGTVEAFGGAGGTPEVHGCLRQLNSARAGLTKPVRTSRVSGPKGGAKPRWAEEIPFQEQ